MKTYRCFYCGHQADPTLFLFRLMCPKCRLTLTYKEVNECQALLPKESIDYKSTDVPIL